IDAFRQTARHRRRDCRPPQEDGHRRVTALDEPQETGSGLLRPGNSQNLAEGEGFEPPVPFRVQWFSRPPPSTTRPSLRGEFGPEFASRSRNLSPTGATCHRKCNAQDDTPHHGTPDALPFSCLYLSKRKPKRLTTSKPVRGTAMVGLRLPATPVLRKQRKK